MEDSQVCEKFACAKLVCSTRKVLTLRVHTRSTNLVLQTSLAQGKYHADLSDTPELR